MFDLSGSAFDTAQIHAGQMPAEHGARITPIHLSAGFVFDDIDDGSARFSDPNSGFSYTRIGNPTIAALERKIAALEGGHTAIAVGSGQAATTTALLALASTGDHIVAAASLYEGTRGLLRDNFSRLGVGVTFLDDAHSASAWRDAIRPETRALFLESIPNARNDVPDLDAIAAIGRKAGVPLVVDSTLATPYLIRPIEHGAAIIVHSASKFLAGHGAALGGVVVIGDFDWASGRFPHLTEPSRSFGGESYVERHGTLAFAEFARHGIAARFGPTLSPIHALLVQQGIETLSLRMQRHSDNALRIASWLENQAHVVSVDYVGLPSHPQHEVAARLLPRGFGSVFTVEVDGGRDGARAFLNALQLTSHMSHLGDVRSLALHPASTSHAGYSPAERETLGIRDGHIRLSIGIESADDIIADLARGLAAVADVTERTAA